MRYLFGISSCWDIKKITRTATESLVKNLYWHFTRILLRKLTEKKGFWELPSICKLSRLSRRFPGRKVYKLGRFEDHTKTVLLSLWGKIA